MQRRRSVAPKAPRAATTRASAVSAAPAAAPATRTSRVSTTTAAASATSRLPRPTAAPYVRRSSRGVALLPTTALDLDDATHRLLTESDDDADFPASAMDAHSNALADDLDAFRTPAPVARGRSRLRGGITPSGAASLAALLAADPDLAEDAAFASPSRADSPGSTRSSSSSTDAAVILAAASAVSATPSRGTVASGPRAPSPVDLTKLHGMSGFASPSRAADGSSAARSPSPRAGTSYAAAVAARYRSPSRTGSFPAALTPYQGRSGDGGDGDDGPRPRGRCCMMWGRLVESPLFWASVVIAVNAILLLVFVSSFGPPTPPPAPTFAPAAAATAAGEWTGPFAGVGSVIVGLFSFSGPAAVPALHAGNSDDPDAPVTAEDVAAAKAFLDEYQASLSSPDFSDLSEYAIERSLVKEEYPDGEWMQVDTLLNEAQGLLAAHAATIDTAVIASAKTGAPLAVESSLPAKVARDSITRTRKLLGPLQTAARVGAARATVRRSELASTRAAVDKAGQAAEASAERIKALEKSLSEAQAAVAAVEARVEELSRERDAAVAAANEATAKAEQVTAAAETAAAAAAAAAASSGSDSDAAAAATAAAVATCSAELAAARSALAASEDAAKGARDDAEAAEAARAVAQRLNSACEVKVASMAEELQPQFDDALAAATMEAHERATIAAAADVADATKAAEAKVQAATEAAEKANVRATEAEAAAAAAEAKAAAAEEKAEAAAKSAAACPVCPEAVVCPAAPTCPEAPSCADAPACPEAPVCPEAPTCPVAPVCPEAPACPVCPSKEETEGMTPEGCEALTAAHNALAVEAGALRNKTAALSATRQQHREFARYLVAEIASLCDTECAEANERDHDALHSHDHHHHDHGHDHHHHHHHHHGDEAHAALAEQLTQCKASCVTQADAYLRQFTDEFGADDAADAAADERAATVATPSRPELEGCLKRLDIVSLELEVMTDKVANATEAIAAATALAQKGQKCISDAVAAAATSSAAQGSDAATAGTPSPAATPAGDASDLAAAAAAADKRANDLESLLAASVQAIEAANVEVTGAIEVARRDASAAASAVTALAVTRRRAATAAAAAADAAAAAAAEPVSEGVSVWARDPLLMLAMKLLGRGPMQAAARARVMRVQNAAAAVWSEIEAEDEENEAFYDDDAVAEVADNEGWVLRSAIAGANTPSPLANLPSYAESTGNAVPAAPAAPSAGGLMGGVDPLHMLVIAVLVLIDTVCFQLLLPVSLPSLVLAVSLSWAGLAAYCWGADLPVVTVLAACNAALGCAVYIWPESALRASVANSVLAVG